jgi:membrane protein YqaA with SNARE-associated domain
MNAAEIFSWLFVDNLVSTLILPLHFEMVLDLMLVFGEYNKLLMLTIAVSGAVLGSNFNYLFGTILISASKHRNSKKQTIDIYEKYSQYSRPISLVILAALGFSYFPGSILQVLAGYFRIKYKPFLSSIGFSHLAYYAIFIYKLTL